MTSQENRLHDPTAWVDHHADYLFGYAMFRLRDKTAAEDVVQETFLAALQAYKRFEGRGSERTWLVGILKHKIFDHFRKLGKNKEIVQTDEFAEEDFEPFRNTGEWAGHWRKDMAPVDWNLDAAALLEKKEFWGVLNRCLSELPPTLARVFVLREIEGLSSPEICELLNITPSNLWVMLHRARLKLRDSIETTWFRGGPVKTTRKTTSTNPAETVFQGRPRAAPTNL